MISLWSRIREVRRYLFSLAGLNALQFEIITQDVSTETHKQLMVTQFGVSFLCLYCVERTKSDYDEQGLDQTGKINLDHVCFFCFFVRHCFLFCFLIYIVMGKNKTFLFLFQSWENPFLRWNPTKYGGVKFINIDPKLVWKPDIVLYNR